MRLYACVCRLSICNSDLKFKMLQNLKLLSSAHMTPQVRHATPRNFDHTKKVILNSYTTQMSTQTGEVDCSRSSTNGIDYR